ncbi:pentapeptide repeat-containing protein [Nostocaceae cyanobacterium CENA369]|uniref:Pentapeptide repeat-containing protein n=1 Tax=Dendronalium phyllosphericum CENA369 TaxID=1725256 RepID=A0A8J7LGF5_9NOST|nr:pentapeptide repeat-containing protein [Dendronalium phyllosphericum]MBH8574849.1 pentapeptide repeat-containing protein [Dendronalium phyllosphericum CENA369]
MLSAIINAYYSAKRQLITNQVPIINIIPGIVLNKEKVPNTSHKALKQCLRLAIEDLNNPKIDNRLAAIYDLELLARDYPEHHWKIMEILTNFVRNHTLSVSQEEVKSQPSITICTDIQLALTVLGRRDVRQDMEEQLDLSHTNLGKANLNQANLELANLYQVNLSGANLSGANLSGAILSAANLFEANLSGANLSGAILSAANLSGANLCGANLHRASLYLTNLHQANLNDAILDGANLREAKFS